MRTVIVGDVHGCARELESLLDEIGFTSGDRLVFVGDLIARGPDSIGVLDIARTTGAVLVRGNHEQRLLDWLDAREREIRGEAVPLLTEPRKVVPRDTSSRGLSIGKAHREIGRALRPIDWSLIQTSKIWVDFPEHDLRVIHAGIDPALPFERQRADTMMQIRKVSGALWGSRYDGPPHIVFGHNAAPGLQIHRWATGLDTGCVYGGRLTAMVLPAGKKIPLTLAARRALLVSVPARRVWSVPEPKSRAHGLTKR